MEIRWIQDADYEAAMKREAEPYTAERRDSGYFERTAGQPLYYEHYAADRPKGAIVISHGFTESVRKYTESVYYMLQAGFDVWGMDHRGHGRSYRENQNPYVVHVTSFGDYVLDLRYFVEQVAMPGSGGLPLFLYAHSMGGCIGAWLLEDAPGLFRRAVLSSPMLGLNFGKIPVPVMYSMARLRALGVKRMEPLSPVNAFPAEPDYDHACASSRCRYLYYFGKCTADPKLQTTAPSLGWGLEAAEACAHVCSRGQAGKVAVPVLLMQAGADDIVDNKAQDRFVSRVSGCGKQAVPGVKHELFMTDLEVLMPYWQRVLSFYMEDMGEGRNH